MDIQKIDKKIKKINVLLDSIKDEGSASSIERDLLLQYTRDLYEEILIAETDLKEVNEDKKAKKHEVKKKEPTAIEHQATQKIVHVEDEVIVKQTIVEQPKPIVLEPQKPIIEPTHPAVVAHQPIVETPKVEAKVDTPSQPPQEESRKPNMQLVEPPKEMKPSSNVSRVAELFLEEKVKELSDKVSTIPIADISKAMGINERILMIKELFGNNGVHYNEVVSRLNALSNMQEAKEFLIHGPAEQYDWDDDKRFDHAFEFIKLVRRRYL